MSECGLVLAIVCIGMGAYAWVRKPRERKREREKGEKFEIVALPFICCSFGLLTLV